VTSCHFKNAPVISMNVGPSGTMVSNSTFADGRVTGVWSGGSPCPTQFTIQNNLFERYGTGAVGLEGCTNHGSAIGNTFHSNHREFVFSAPGGQLTVSPDAHHLLIQDNVFDGGLVESSNGLWITMGIEAWGQDLTIKDNDIHNQRGDGISCLDCQRVE